MLNLPSPPPNFAGLHPDKPVTVYHRHLPHWRQEGATYFVAFRLGDALPQDKLQYLKRLRAEWERTHPAPRSDQDWENYTREIVRRAEAWLDEGCGARHFRNGQLANELAAALLHFQDQRYFLSCSVIMPNHCHCLIRPFSDWPLETILQGMKGTVAHRVNQINETSGSIWQEESYDRIVRDGEHLWRCLQYIGRNPRMANLPRDKWHRWVHPIWQTAGWDFRDEE